jgi:protein-S-isoprenylcysteine O-methyltransferase Ste14
MGQHEREDLNAARSEPAMKSVFDWVRRHGQELVNWFLFVTLGYAACYRAWHAWTANNRDFIAIAFFTDTVVMLLIILFRQKHRAINGNLFQQAVALVAFFSGIALDEHQTSSLVLVDIARGMMLVTLVLSMICMLNLGRSFGILIAARTIKTGGPYAIVRHPIYATDISLRVAFILQNHSAYNITIAVVSIMAYVYRAILEERFLSQFPEYRDYAQRVRYRFIPGVF